MRGLRCRLQLDATRTEAPTREEEPSSSKLGGDAVDQEERFTALMFAAAEGHADVVRTLLRHGSDPDIVDVDGDRALDFAARNGHEEVVRLLSDEQGRKQE